MLVQHGGVDCRLFLFQVFNQRVIHRPIRQLQRVPIEVALWYLRKREVRRRWLSFSIALRVRIGRCCYLLRLGLLEELGLRLLNELRLSLLREMGLRLLRELRLSLLIVLRLGL